MTHIQNVSNFAGSAASFYRLHLILGFKSSFTNTVLFALKFNFLLDERILLLTRSFKMPPRDVTGHLECKTSDVI